MCVGAAAGINVVLKTLLDPGNEVIFFSPISSSNHFYVDYHGGWPSCPHPMPISTSTLRRWKVLSPTLQRWC